MDYTALCCTQVLRRQMLQNTPKLNLLAETASIHDRWYAHSTSIERRDCVLFTHVGTLYSVLAIGLSAVKFSDLRKVFYSSISQQLNAEHISSDKQQHILGTWQAMGYSICHDKRVLGSMNDFLRLYRIEIDADDGILRCDIDRINCHINRTTPMSLLQNLTPTEAFAQRFRVNFPATPKPRRFCTPDEKEYDPIIVES